MLTAHPPTAAEHALAGVDLVDHLPVALALLDLDAIIRRGNPRLAELVGAADVADLVGRPVWELIDGDDATEVAMAFQPNVEFATSVLGPVSVRLRAARGSVPTTCWARVIDNDDGLAGYLVTLEPESTDDMVAAAMRGFAAGGELAITLDQLAEATGALPLNGAGTILTVADGEVAATHGAWPLTGDRALRHPDTPWVGVALGTRDGGHWPVDELPPAAARIARAHGFGAVWIAPIDVDGQRRGAVAVWRRSSVAPFLTHTATLQEVARAAALAFAQDDHRRQLQHAALADHLTGVANRARLEARMLHETVQPCGVLFVDLDGFKQVNDRYGHLMGDRVLRLAAERLSRLVRPQDVVYRVGGDEFVVVCGPSGERAIARELSERMARYVVDAIAAPFDVDGTTLIIGASVGVAIADETTPLSTALDLADDALLAAKRNGRGRWQSPNRP